MPVGLDNPQSPEPPHASNLGFLAAAMVIQNRRGREWPNKGHTPPTPPQVVQLFWIYYPHLPIQFTYDQIRFAFANQGDEKAATD